MEIKCSKCGREFMTEAGLNIHFGRAHWAGSQPATTAQPAVEEAAKPAAVGVACPVCGRTFKMALHLGRHMKSAHPAGRMVRIAKVAPRKPGRPAKVASGQDLSSLSVEQLLAVRSEVDSLLQAILDKIEQVA